MSSTVNVSSLTQLYAALANAKGGEQILLAGGDYGAFKLGVWSAFDITFPSNVTIKSADPTNPAVFSQMDLRDVGNLTIDGVTFDYTYQAGHPIYKKPFNLTGCDNVTIRNSTFDGDTIKGTTGYDEGLGTGIGLGIRGCTDVRIENNEVFGFYRGLVMGGGERNVVTGNELHDIRMDGMNFSSVQGIVIEDNYLHDFSRSTNVLEHADMIQFHTSGSTRPSTDIVIRGNTLDIGEGSSTQSIFMRNDMVDRGLAGEEMYYRNVLIEDNVIYNGHLHGISVGETTGLTIRNNSVMHSDGAIQDGRDGGVEIPRINVAGVSTGVVITGNATSSIVGYTGQSGWSVSNNAFIQDQDPRAPGYYGDVFITSSLTGDGGVNEYVARPGGMLDRLNAGAAGTSYEKVTATLEAQFNVLESDHNGAVRIFDAGVTSSKFSALPTGTLFFWNFGDGTTSKGAVVSHVFRDGGQYDVKLTVRLPDGTTDMQVSKIAVAGPKILELGSAGDFLSYDCGVVTTFEAGPAGTAGGLELGAPGVVASVRREALEELFGSNNFEIAMTLQADKIDAQGELFRLHKSFVAYVTPAGELKFIMNMADGKTVTLTTSGAKLDDLAAHELNIKFDDGKLQIYVDGGLEATGTASGPMSTSGTANLVFGNPWGGTNFDGDLKALLISVNGDDFKSSPVQSAPPLATVPAEALDFGGLVLDLSDGAPPPSVKFAGDAHIAETTHGAAIVLDGNGDYVSLGKVASVAASDKIAFSVDFARDEASDEAARLVWSHLKLGLTLSGDDIVVQAATENEGFKSFTVKGLGLNDTDLHRAVVMADAGSDRLMVVVDDKVVLNVTDTDFDFSEVVDRGWTIGTPWNRFFDGSVTDFRLGDRFEFLDGQQASALQA